MEINSLAGLFFLKLKTSVFLFTRRHVQSSLLPKFDFFVLLVSTMLGLRAWSDDLVVVLFEFLERGHDLNVECRKDVNSNKRGWVRL